MLEELKQLFKEDGIEVTDQAALEAGLWLLTRIKSINGGKIPANKKELWDEICSQAEHPHGMDTTSESSPPI